MQNGVEIIEILEIVTSEITPKDINKTQKIYNVTIVKAMDIQREIVRARSDKAMIKRIQNSSVM